MDKGIRKIMKRRFGNNSKVHSWHNTCSKSRQFSGRKFEAASLCIWTVSWKVKTSIKNTNSATNVSCIKFIVDCSAVLFCFVSKYNLHAGQLNILSLFPAFLYDHNYRQQWHRSQGMPPAQTPEFWSTLRLWCREQWDIGAFYPLSLYS